MSTPTPTTPSRTPFGTLPSRNSRRRISPRPAAAGDRSAQGFGSPRRFLSIVNRDSGEIGTAALNGLQAAAALQATFLHTRLTKLRTPKKGNEPSSTQQSEQSNLGTGQHREVPDDVEHGYLRSRPHPPDRERVDGHANAEDSDPSKKGSRRPSVEGNDDNAPYKACRAKQTRVLASPSPNIIISDRG